MTFTLPRYSGAKQGIRTEGFQETAVDRTEQDKPEQQQNLVLTEMQDKKLDRKEMIGCF